MTQLVHEYLACRKGSVSLSIKNVSSIFKSIIRKLVMKIGDSFMISNLA